VLRLKFKSTEAELHAASKIMHPCATMVQVDQHFGGVPADPKDNHIVECAVAAKADAIISGDHHLFGAGFLRPADGQS
jgi:putative PIN family toxin of toxin-antitoxin system